MEKDKVAKIQSDIASIFIKHKLQNSEGASILINMYSEILTLSLLTLKSTKQAKLEMLLDTFEQVKDICVQDLLKRMEQEKE